MAKAKTTKAKKAKAVSQVTIDRMAAEITRIAVRLDDVNRYHETLHNKMTALEGEAEVRSAAITQVSDLFTTLRRVLNNASAELAGAASYTQQEISRMSADEYCEKVLVPLNMGRRV
jgi:predicted  nucleic acid-binding Zn-ribbon protein